MFVYCSECNNHYDDQSQQKKCMGPGRGVVLNSSESGDDTRTSHPVTGPKPVTEANRDAKACAAGQGNLPR